MGNCHCRLFQIMSTEQESEVFSSNFVSAGRCRGGPHGVGQIFYQEFVHENDNVFCLI